MTAPRRRGRPSAYRDEFAGQARKLCLLGATDAELADFFGVSRTAITRWKGAYPAFRAALNAGKAMADGQVADKLYRRAMGYSHRAVKIFADAKTGAEHVVTYTERYPPDTTACIFWLKNRRPAQWRDRQDDPVADPQQTARAVREALRKMAAADGTDGTDGTDDEDPGDGSGRA